MTLQTVIRPDEVNLDSIRYRLHGPVNITLPETYGEKIVLGDFTEANQKRISTIRWTDWSGGMGQQVVSPQDNEVELRRCWWADTWIYNKGHLLPGKRTVSIDGEPANIKAGVHFNGQFYFAGTDVARTTTSSASLTDTTHNLTNPPVMALSGRINGSDNIIWCVDGSGYEFSTDGSSYSTGGREAHFGVMWDDRFWGFDVDDNQLFFTLAPSTTAGDHENDAVLPVQVGEALGMFVGPDAGNEDIIYIIARDGLWAHDAANARFVRTPFRLRNPIHVDASDTIGDYNIQATTWLGAIYIPIGLSVWEYHPVAGTVRNIGPDNEDLTVSGEDVRGPIRTVVHSDRELFVCNDGIRNLDGPAARPTFLRWNRRGWSIFHRGGSTTPGTLSNVMVVGVHEQTSIAPYEIFFHFITVGNDAINRMVLPTDTWNPKQDTLWEYADTDLITPWIDLGTDSPGIALRIKLDCIDLDANNTVILSYRTDFANQTVGGGFTALGSTITSDGVTTLTFPDDGASIEGLAARWIQFKIAIAVNAVTDAPEVLSVEFEYYKKPDTRLGFQFDIDMRKPYADRSPLDQFFALQNSIKNSTVLLELTWKDTSKTQSNLTRTYYVGVTGLQMVEEGTGSSDGGIMRVFAEEI